MSEWNLVYEFSDCISEKTLSCLSFVNIGGGIPSEYANTNMDVISGISNKINDFRKDRALQDNVCSMCGEYCAIKIVKDYFKE